MGYHEIHFYEAFLEKTVTGLKRCVKNFIHTKSYQ